MSFKIKPKVLRESRTREPPFPRYELGWVEKIHAVKQPADLDTKFPTTE